MGLRQSKQLLIYILKGVENMKTFTDLVFQLSLLSLFFQQNTFQNYFVLLFKPLPLYEWTYKNFFY